MVRLVYVVLISLPFVIYYLLKSHYVANHMEKYPLSVRYDMAQRIIRIIKKNGRIQTTVYGEENLPKDGGYVMYPNHQGKYDALGIIDAHKSPCSFMIDSERSKLILANEFTMLLEAVRLDKKDPRSQVKSIQDTVKRVAAGGRYIIFPEGGYENNGNNLQEFLPGAFKCSVRTKTPIIPVALIDSYKVFGINSLKKIKTEVHFLKPLYYEEYHGMSTKEIAGIVRERIESVLQWSEA